MRNNDDYQYTIYFLDQIKQDVPMQYKKALKNLICFCTLEINDIFKGTSYILSGNKFVISSVTSRYGSLYVVGHTPYEHTYDSYLFSYVMNYKES